jgi:O-antigen/teichoic acid export membrane protein
MNWSALRDAVRHPDVLLVQRWAFTFVEFSLMQLAVQLVGAATGIMVVRLLSPRDYALYTVANSILAAFVILSDGGIGSAAVGIGGRIWQERVQLGSMLNTARRSVRMLGSAVSIPVAIAFAGILVRNGASALEISILGALTLAGGAFALFTSIDLAVVRLLGDTRFIQASALGAAGLRLIATAALAVFGLLVETAMLGIVLGWVVQCWATRRWVHGKVPPNAPTDSRVSAELKSVVIRQFPNSLYYVAQAQLSIWLLSIFGSVSSVADLGAVTRISILFSTVLATMQNVVVPRYARCQDPERLARLYVQICLGFSLLVLAPTVLVALAPKWVLWVLGPQYAHLSTELVLAVLGAAVGSISGLAWSLNTNRAWFPPSWIWIPVDLAAQLMLALAIGVSTARQVLTVAILASLLHAAMNLIAGAVFVRRFHRAKIA